MLYITIWPCCCYDISRRIQRMDPGADIWKQKQPVEIIISDENRDIVEVIQSGLNQYSDSTTCNGCSKNIAKNNGLSNCPKEHCSSLQVQQPTIEVVNVACLANGSSNIVNNAAVKPENPSNEELVHVPGVAGVRDVDEVDGMFDMMVVVEGGDDFSQHGGHCELQQGHADNGDQQHAKEMVVITSDISKPSSECSDWSLTDASETDDIDEFVDSENKFMARKTRQRSKSLCYFRLGSDSSLNWKSDVENSTKHVKDNAADTLDITKFNAECDISYTVDIGKEECNASYNANLENEGFGVSYLSDIGTKECDVLTFTTDIGNVASDSNKATQKLQLVHLEDETDKSQKERRAVSKHEPDTNSEECSSIRNSTEEVAGTTIVNDDEGIVKPKSLLSVKSAVTQKRYGRAKHEYEEPMCELMKRKRSKSAGNVDVKRHSFDFVKHGISVGKEYPHELLPGIEQFLCTVLAEESLSPHAEEQRQYFLERLDIIKMPPSVPPRPQSLGIKLYPVSTTQPPDATHLPQKHGSISIEQEEDFAAYQRELSRALLEQTADSPAPVEHKLYDDIDLADDARKATRRGGSDDDDESMYEIPKLHRDRTSSDGGYEKTTDVATTISKAVSSDHISTLVPPIPPPLPPRKEHNSVNSLLEEGSPDAGLGQGIAPQDGVGQNSVTQNGVGPGVVTQDGGGKGLVVQNGVGRSSMIQDLPIGVQSEGCGDTRSERSTDDVLDTDEFDGMSCDSMEWTGSTPHLSIELPKSSRKKKRQQRQRPLSYSLKESKHTFHALQDVCLSGELHHRSTLSWTRRMAAITSGKLVCYKPEKLDSRPTVVILLAGYRATFQERESRKSFEISLTHPTLESQLFLTDFKEWATIWCEHINCAAEGKKALGPILHLARGAEIGEKTSTLTKTRLQSSDSNLSVASSDDFDGEPGTVRVKKIDQSGIKTARMGTFAYRASQFFESLSGRKPSVKKKSGSTSSDKLRPLSDAQSMTSLCDSSSSPMTMSPVTPMSPIGSIVPITPESEMSESERTKAMIELERHIKHQGYLDIYSSFNKRKWGKRWCMVHKNSFECYRTQTSEVCELEFVLTPCVLQRAVQETKSDLGLMLLENNREKITIEPMNWTELGSWLRVLMAETSTSATPEGLEGYMDDTNPYHEAVEIKRLSDPFPPSPAPTQQVPSLPKRPLCSTRSDNNIGRATNPDGRNRDSGNCSAESADSRFNSLDGTQTGSLIHPSYPDTSLPRVRAHDTGDIYTQIRKTSTTSLRKNSSQNHTGAQNAIMSDSAKRLEQNNSMDGTKFVFDFEDCDNPVPYNTSDDGSLMDEIMSQFRSQLSTDRETVEDVPHADKDTIKHVPHADISETLHEHEELVSQSMNSNSPCNTNGGVYKESINLDAEPVSSLGVNDASQNASMCSASKHTTDTASSVGTGDEDKSVMTTCDKTIETSSGRQHEGKSDTEYDHNSSANTKAPIILEPYDSSADMNGTRKFSDALNHRPSESIEELRTRLVQLKKDRIHIRDRKLQTSSQVDKEYLEAEFDRLNRECTKVMEEIGYMELLENQTHVGSSVEGHAATDLDIRDARETHAGSVVEGHAAPDPDIRDIAETHVGSSVEGHAATDPNIRDASETHVGSSVEGHASTGPDMRDTCETHAGSSGHSQDSDFTCRDSNDEIIGDEKLQEIRNEKEIESIQLEPNPESDDDLEKTLTVGIDDNNIANDGLGENYSNSTGEANSSILKLVSVQEDTTHEVDTHCVQGLLDPDVHATVTQDINKNDLARRDEMSERNSHEKDSTKESNEKSENAEKDLIACKTVQELETGNSPQSNPKREIDDTSIDSDVQNRENVKVSTSNPTDVVTDIDDVVVMETDIAELNDTVSVTESSDITAVKETDIAELDTGVVNESSDIKATPNCPTDDAVVERMSEIGHEEHTADADTTTDDDVCVDTVDEDDTHELIQKLAQEFETKLHLEES